MMGVESFDDFWRRLAETRLGAREAMPVEAILAGLLRMYRTCIVCHLLWERAFDRMARWQYVLTQDPARLGEFRERQTWCNRHAWFFKEVASPRTLVSLYRGLLAGLQARIKEQLRGNFGGTASGNTSAVLHDLAGRRRCPQCEDEAAFRQVLMATLAEGLSAGPLRQAFAESAGCCLPHLAALLSAVRGEDTVRFVLEATLTQLRRLAAELDTYETEAESHRRAYGSAADAPLRGLVAWSGLRGLVQGAEWEGRLSRLSAGMEVHGDGTGGCDDGLDPSRSVQSFLGG